MDALWKQVLPQGVGLAIEQFEQGTLDEKHSDDLKRFIKLVRKVRTSSSILRIVDTRTNAQHFAWRGSGEQSLT